MLSRCRFIKNTTFRQEVTFSNVVYLQSFEQLQGPGGATLTEEQEKIKQAINDSAFKVCRPYSYQWTTCSRQSCPFPHRCAGCNKERVAANKCTCDQGRLMRAGR